MFKMRGSTVGACFAWSCIILSCQKLKCNIQNITYQMNNTLPILVSFSWQIMVTSFFLAISHKP